MRFDKAVQAKLPLGELVERSQEALIDRTSGFWTDVGVDNGAAHSGSEANDLFLSANQGAEFVDIGPVSGFDDRGDGRGLVAFDLDGDAFPDYATINANRPRLRLLRNTLGESLRSGAVSIRLIGAASPTTDDGRLSARDAIGARLVGRAGDRVLVRELTRGEGLASTGSGAIWFGLGEARQLDRLVVHWPSGRRTELGPIAAGQRLVVDEVEGASVEPGAAWSGAPRPPADVGAPLPAVLAASVGPGPVVLTSFASWCGACVEEIPELRRLAQDLGPAVRFLGVPVDVEDSDAAISNFLVAHQPPWELVLLPPAERAAVRSFLADAVRIEAVPTMVVVWRGRVALVTPGRATLSEVRTALIRGCRDVGVDLCPSD